MEKNTTMNNDSDLIELVRAASDTEIPCSPSLEWLAGLPTGTTPEQAWRLCPDATWLFWIAGKIGIDKVLIVLSACDIAENVLHLVTPGENRPHLAIETTRAWARGEATLEDVKKTANAAYAATRTAAYAASYAASNVAYAATRVADASAYAATRVASYAASNVAYAATDAAAEEGADAADAYANSRATSLSRFADLIRVRIPWSLVAERLAALGIAV